MFTNFYSLEIDRNGAGWYQRDTVSGDKETVIKEAEHLRNVWPELGEIIVTNVSLTMEERERLHHYLDCELKAVLTGHSEPVFRYASDIY